MDEWRRPGLPGGHLSIVELHQVAVVSDSRIRYDHTPDADLLEHVRIIPDLEGADG